MNREQESCYIVSQMNTRPPSSLVLFIGLLVMSISSCRERTPEHTAYDYGTQSDSARYYFIKGWEEILDNGRWTESEAAFRKAMEFDPDWPTGKSLVGRITRNLEERQRLLSELQAIKDQVAEDERLLLDIFMPSMQAMNNRDQGIRSSAQAGRDRRARAEINFRKFVHRHPEESYILAEYIETLHANHGAQTALDSLNALASDAQHVLGFFMSYKASLELETGNTEAAKELLNILRYALPDSSYTSPLMLEAQIYMAQDSLLQAGKLINKVVKMDPNHLIALGMKNRVDQLLKEQEGR